jgi:leader peptidase (prepilin peptidase)/N-methyltransferase
MALLSALQAHPPLLVALAVIVGLMIGSFLNVVIHRLPKILERQWQADYAETRGAGVADLPPYNLVVPRSACPACGHRITALENIPLVSYAVLGGKCSACRAPIGVRYPLVEAAAGLLAGYIAWRYGFTAKALAAMVFCWAVLAAAVIDLDTFYLPDDITLPLVWAGLLVNVGGTFIDLQSAVIGAAAGYLVLWSVYWVFRLVAKKEGMGYGDFKLLAAIGAWLGWAMLPFVILASSLVGAVIGGGALLVRGRDRNTPIPFGPYLAVAGVIALFWGDAITKHWLKLL